MTPKILIHMEGGLIQSVCSDAPVEVYVVDYDIDGVEEDHPHLTKFNGENCILFKMYADEDAVTVNLAKKTWSIA